MQIIAIGEVFDALDDFVAVRKEMRILRLFEHFHQVEQVAYSSYNTNMALCKHLLVLAAHEYGLNRGIQLFLLAIAAPKLSQPEALMIAKSVPELIFQRKDFSYGNSERIFTHFVIAAVPEFVKDSVEALCEGCFYLSEFARLVRLLDQRNENIFLEFLLLGPPLDLLYIAEKKR